tara:strand:+ start:164 stop:304 length:141 start_codon:yes stop_codon:yes gene_type:complete
MTLEERRERKYKMYKYFRDNLEEKLAGINAAIAKMEEQMSEDKVEV